MSVVRIDIVASATQLAQELENASNLINKLRGEGNLTGQNLAQSFTMASQAQKTFREQLTRLSVNLRENKADMTGAMQGLRSLSKTVKVTDLNMKDLSGSFDILNSKYQQNKASLTVAEKVTLLYLKRIMQLRGEQAKLASAQTTYRNALDMTSVSVNRLRVANNGLVSSNRDLGRSFSGVMSAARQVAGVFGIGLGLHGLVMLMRSTVGTIADFDQQMRTLASVSGATGVEMERLSSLAIRVGAASKFGATGVAELMTELSKMGFAVEEINNMTDGIVKLSTAAGEDLSTSAETVGNIIRAMGYDAADTGKIVDTMALAFNKSALDLSRFRESMKYISPLARSVGFSIEDVSAILAKLSDAGISGSMAGTSVRNIFMSLSDESSELSKKIGGSVKSFDDFIDAMIRLEEAGTGADEMFKLIDLRAVTALNTIKDNSGSIRELSVEMEQARGEVDKMANIQMQSLTNQSKLALEAWKGWILAIDNGDGVLSSFLKETMQRAARNFQDFTREMELQSKQMQDDVSVIKMLEGVTKNSNSTLEEKINIVKRLNQEYPEMFAGMRLEADNWTEIEKAISKAVTQKSNYLALQFGREDITEASVQVQRLEQDYNKLSRGVRLLVESLDEQSEEYKQIVKDIEFATGATARQEQRTALLNQKIGDTNVRLGEFKDALQIKRFMEPYITEINRAIAANERFIVQNFEAPEAVNFDEFAAENRALTDEYIDLMNRETAAALNNGAAKKEAAEIGFKAVEKALTAEIDVRWDNINALHEMLKGTNIDLEKEKEIRNRIAFEMEQLRKVMGNISDLHKDNLGSLKEEGLAAAEILRIRRNIEELQTRIALEGSEQEEKLAEIRLRYANLIAEKTMEDKERDLTIQANNLQYELDLQAVAAQRIRETMVLEQDAHERVVDNIKRQQQAESFALEGVGETAREQQINRDMRALEVQFKFEEDIRKASLEAEKKKLEDEYKIAITSWAKQTPERIKLEENLDAELLNLQANFDAESLRRMRTHVASIIDLQEKIYDIKLEQHNKESQLISQRNDLERDSEMYQAQRIGSLWDAMDILGQRTREIRELEKEHHIQKLEEQQKELDAERKIIEAKLLSMQTLIGAEDVDQTDLAVRIKNTKDLLDQLNFEYTKTGKLLTRALNPELNVDQWNAVISTMKDVGSQLVGVYQSILDEQLRLATEERAMRDRSVSELQRDIEIQLQLNEQGFASNVQAYMQALEAEKQVRDKALVDEKKAAEQKRAIEKIVQTVNLLSSVSNVLKESSKLGPLGIIAAAAGIAGIFTLWGSSLSKSKSATSYEKGGSFMLNGRSHAEGGIMLAPGREAQGGEMVSVFSRQATQRYGSEIKSVTDAFNSGFYRNKESSASIDMKDVKAIRKLMESNESMTIQGNYKIIKRGNKTTVCRLN
jgi:TP901 family phage tail tape measure protein